MPVNVTVQPTPNPNAMKFTLDAPAFSGPSKTYASAAEAADNAIASQILALPGVQQVFFLNNFVTVTKKPDAIWADIGPDVEAALRQHLG